MKMMIRIISGLVLVSLIASLETGALGSNALPRSTPEAQGIASRAILEFIKEAEAKVDALHSFMLVRHGQVVAEGWWKPYGPRRPHVLYSLSKSFTSTAVGLAAAEGLFSIDDTVLSFFPEDAPDAPSGNLKAMRVRDLLCMSTGHQTEPSSAPHLISAKSFLAHPVPFKPGTHFLYNTPATFMQSAIIQKATGQTVLDYLRTRLFAPLGISNPTWDTNFQGISLGGYGLSLRTEDIARFGQLFLQKGQWQGQQLVPAAWVEAATARQTSNGSNPKSDWDQGYGFQFWRCRHGAYRGDGAFGQYCIVMPEEDAVIAITSGLRDMQAVLNLVWDKLLPAMHDRKLDQDTATQRELQSKLASLELPAQAGSATSPLLAQVSGKTFSFPTNSLGLESLLLEATPHPNDLKIRTRITGQDQVLAPGYGKWNQDRFTLGSAAEQAAALSGAWVADDTYVARLCMNETPYILTLKLKFDADQLLLEAEYNVSFGPTRLPPMTGRVK